MKEFQENILTDKNSSELINTNSYIFQKWKQILKKSQINKIQSLSEKRSVLATFKQEYEQVMKNREINKDNLLVFSLQNFVRLIKYLNSSNNFFDNRFTPESLDEILLLVYIYEWICLEKDKDESILGKKEEVIKKFKFQVYHSNSEYKKIFENLDLDFDESFLIFKERISKYTWITYEKLIKLISSDVDLFEQIDRDITNSNFNNNESAYLKLWKELFEIKDDKFIYSYNIKNSDDKFICISIQSLSKNENIATVKYKIFDIFTYKNGLISQSDVGKELYSIDHITKRIQLDLTVVMSKTLELSNTIISSIFLKDIKLKVDESKKIVNFVVKK